MKLKDPNGYTLAEALMAISLFLLIIVPFIGKMNEANQFNKGREILTALFILEQEKAIIQNNPSDIYSSKKRMVDGKEWQLKTTVRGESFKTVNLSIAKNSKTFEIVEFYVYNR